MVAQLKTGAQIRAARALLNWTRPILAQAAGIHRNAVAYWEKHEQITPNQQHALDGAPQRITRALEAAGVVFVDRPCPGVCLQNGALAGGGTDLVPVITRAEAEEMGDGKVRVSQVHTDLADLIARFGVAECVSEAQFPRTTARAREDADTPNRSSAANPKVTLSRNGKVTGRLDAADNPKVALRSEPPDLNSSKFYQGPPKPTTRLAPGESEVFDNGCSITFDAERQKYAIFDRAGQFHGFRSAYEAAASFANGLG